MLLTLVGLLAGTSHSLLDGVPDVVGGVPIVIISIQKVLLKHTVEKKC